MPPISADVALEAADRRACRALIVQGSRSFYNASRVLPSAVRDPAYALYAFCRTADDAIDTVAPSEVEAALEALHRRLDRVYAGCPADDPVERGFARVVDRFALPRALPEALLDGFAWDAEGRDYETIEDVRAYGARVAGSVGAMMAVLMGARSGPVVARAVDLGVAMQLTNIVRDVGEDARAGRLYLPKRWMRDAGIDPVAWRAAPRFDAALGSVVRQVLDEAETLYQRAGAGIGQLPVACRPGIRAAQLIYAEIGRELARRGLDSVGRRVVVRGGRKLALLGWALITSQRVDPGLAVAPLPETRFLVDAVAGTPTPAPRLGPNASFDERAEWVVDLMLRLERGNRGASSSLEGATPG